METNTAKRDQTIDVKDEELLNTEEIKGRVYIFI